MKKFLRKITPLRACTFAEFRKGLSKSMEHLEGQYDGLSTAIRGTDAQIETLMRQIDGLREQNEALMRFIDERVISKLDSIAQQNESAVELIDQMRINYNCDNAHLVEAIEQVQNAVEQQ